MGSSTLVDAIPCLLADEILAVLDVWEGLEPDQRQHNEGVRALMSRSGHGTPRVCFEHPRPTDMSTQLWCIVSLVAESSAIVSFTRIHRVQSTPYAARLTSHASKQMRPCQCRPH